MVGFMIMSHSESLTKSVMELTLIMVPSMKIAQAGGMGDEGFGTSPEKIQAAIEFVCSDDGVLVLMDVGSAVVVTGMVVETCEGKKVEMVDCSLVEGAMVVIISSVDGMGFGAIKKALTGVGTPRKF